MRGASGRRARRLLGQRGRRRPGRARRARALPVLDRREDDLAVRAARARPQRARVDARRSPTTRSSRRRAYIERLGASRGAAADPRDRGRSSRRSRRGAGRRRGARGGARASSTRSRPSCSSRCSPRPSRRRWCTRPTSATSSRRSARSRSTAGCSRARPRPRPRRDPRAARPRRLRAGQHRGARRHALADRRPALGCGGVVRRGRGARAPRPRRCAWPASPTRTGCARRSARSPTGSSRRADGLRRSRRGSSTRPTSACRSPISSSASAGCGTPRRPSAG